MNSRTRLRAILSRRSFSRSALIAAMAALSLPFASRAQAVATAAAPVESLDQGLLSVMKAGRAAPFDTRLQSLTPVIEQSFDLPRILASSVGPRFASFSPDQQSDLLRNFTQFTAASYVANFDSYSGEKFDIAPDTRRAGADEVVETSIVSPSGKATRLDYVVRPSGDSFKIVDVLLDGSISRVAVQRSDFRSLLSGGDPAPLIAMLRTKVAGLAAGNKG